MTTIRGIRPRPAFLMPPDLRDWMSQDDLVHFIIAAVERVDMKKFAINHSGSGSGSAQYDPLMMLALIIYCDANRIFASRRRISTSASVLSL